MANKKLYWLSAALGIGVASAGAWWLQHRAPASSAASEQAAGTVGAAGEKGKGGGAAPGAAQSGGRAGGGGGMPSVEIAQVKRARLQDDAQAVGTLRSRQSVTLKPEVSGRVARIAFADGAQVRKGQLLVQLDDVLQRAELSQAQAQLSIARANLKRNQELVAEKFVAPRVVEESEANLQVAEAQVALAQARLSRMRVIAPFDGTVGISSVSLGEYVKDGADLVNLEDTSALLVDFRLPERYQTRIALGQAVEVQLDALPGKAFSAKVQALDPLLDANGRSVAVRAVLAPKSGEQLRPGMFARVLTVFSVDDAALVVPEEAIVPQGGKQYVIRLQDEGEGDAKKRVSSRTEVQLGVRRGASVQVVSGLAEGDTVVVAGQQRLQKDGTAVRVVDMSKPGKPRTAGSGPGNGPENGPGGNKGERKGEGQGEGKPQNPGGGAEKAPDATGAASAAAPAKP